MNPIVLQDSNGLLWTISVNSFGQIIATGGSPGTAVGVYINDSSGASWLFTFNPTIGNIQASPVTPARDFPTSLELDASWFLGVNTFGLVNIFPTSLLPLWQQTVISQYANSPTLLAMIESFNAAVAPDGDIDNFYSWIWNMQTAQGFGLDIWGRIVGVSRVLDIEINGSNVLPDYAFLLLIQLKAAENLWDGTIAGAYNIFKALFSSDGYSVQIFDNLNMTMLILFGGLPGSDPYIETIMERYFNLVPAGVLAITIGNALILQDTSGQRWLVYLDDGGVFHQITISAGTVSTPILADANGSGNNWPILISTNGELEIGTSVAGTYPSSVPFQTAPSWIAAEMIVNNQTIKATGAFA